MDQICLGNDRVRISCGNLPEYREQIALYNGTEWVPVLESFPYAVRPSDERYAADFALDSTAASVEKTENGLAVTLEHPEHTVTRELRLSDTPDAVDIAVTFRTKRAVRLRAVEDLWNFLPDRRDEDTPLSGPLDFVWSQRIKSFPNGFVPHYSFRTPVIMMQQGTAFAGLVPGLEGIGAEQLGRFPLGMDLDVTRAEHPWMSYGIIVGLPAKPDHPCTVGHSQITRGTGDEFSTVSLEAGESLTYRYTLLVSSQPEKRGYQYAVRYLWQRYGIPQMEEAKKPVENPRFPEIRTLEDWEAEIWDKRTEADFFTYEKGGKTVGAITGRRQGEWFSRTDNRKDAWFACWLQELVTGYGMALYGRKTKEKKWTARAEQILNLILSAPRSHGMFPVICYYESDGSETWLKDDGWAGFRGEYHALQMSWTAWLMLRWGNELFPDRMEEIQEFCGTYADFLLENQQESGNIPAWYGDDGKPSRKQFREFNAETAVSALFLMEFGSLTHSETCINAGFRSLDFITREVLPRQRWFDLETFLSCARKPFSFYDSITAQYPQCNLSEIYAAAAYLKRYTLTKRAEDLQLLEQMTDYLLLTQQIWNHPMLHIKPFGGFTVQNTDNEWSDVREGLCAILLYHIYLATGKQEYWERCIAAARSGFEVLPYENWAHCGYEGMQYDSSLLWGGGVILTAAEYLDAQIRQQSEENIL